MEGDAGSGPLNPTDADGSSSGLDGLKVLRVEAGFAKRGSCRAGSRGPLGAAMSEYTVAQELSAR